MSKVTPDELSAAESEEVCEGSDEEISGESEEEVSGESDEEISGGSDEGIGGETDEDDNFDLRKTGTEPKDTPGKDQALPHEWIEFNKKVVSLRPLFKSAKVQFIHKTTRTISSMRKKKGTPEQVDKNNKKADRLVQEITYIKGLKNDVLARFALLHSKEEISKIINSADSTMGYRVKAKVACASKVAEAAAAYHSEHPDWRETLFNLIQLAGKSMKRKRRKLRGKGRHKRKPTGAPKKAKNERGSAVSEVQQANKSGAEGVVEGSCRFDSSKFPAPPTQLESDGTSDSGDSNLDLSDSSEVEEEPSQLGSNETNVKLGLAKKGKSSTAFKPKESSKVKETLENYSSKSIKSIGKLGASKNQTIHRRRGSSEKSSGEDSSNDSLEPPSNVDPFFMTSDNKEYKSVWQLPSGDLSKLNKTQTSGAKSFGNSKKMIPFSGANNISKSSKAVETRKRTAQPEPVKALHPSWQAKKKLNVTTAAFQGKKIVFGDE